MEELGEEEEKLHETLGSKIKLNENDLVLLIGQKASWMAKGILAAGRERPTGFGTKGWQ